MRKEMKRGNGSMTLGGGDMEGVQCGRFSRVTGRGEGEAIFIFLWVGIFFLFFFQYPAWVFASDFSDHFFLEI